MVGKRVAAVFLAVAMVVTFMPAMGMQPAYGAESHEIAFNLSVTPRADMTLYDFTGSSLRKTTSKQQYYLEGTKRPDHEVESHSKIS